MVFGLALVLALLFGVATMALAAMPGDPFRLGQGNRINEALTTLVGSRGGAMMAIDNDSTAANARALDLRVEPNRAPMVVNSDKKVRNLNADQVDGHEGDDLAEPRGYAHVELAGGVDPDYPSKGVIGVIRPDPSAKPGVYCFDLTFTPKIAVGSPHPNNSAVVATETPDEDTPRRDAVVGNCQPPHQDAMVHTYGSSRAADAAINFQILFE